MIWKARPEKAQALAVPLLLLSITMIWGSADGVIITVTQRAAYLVAIAFYPAVAWFLFKYLWPRVDAKTRPSVRQLAAGITLLGLNVSLLMVLDVQAFHLQRHVVSPATAHALAWLKENDPHANVVTNHFQLSLWISALNRIRAPTLWVPPPLGYADSNDQIRCLLGWVPDCDPAAARGALGVDYVLVDQRLDPARFIATDQWAVTAATTWLRMVLQEAETRLYHIDGLCSAPPEVCNNAPQAAPNATP
jgi:hypothetical protein